MFTWTDNSISIFSFYSLLCQLQYHAISSVQTFICILSCCIFSCDVCMIECFHVSEYPETISSIWSQIKILIFLFFFFLVCLFLYLGYTMQHAGSQFSNVDETRMDPVLCEGEGQNPNHRTTREVPDSDKFEQSCDPSLHPLSSHHQPSISTFVPPAFPGFPFGLLPTCVPWESILGPSQFSKIFLTANQTEIRHQFF